jgi:hypothetical protein
VGNRTFLSSSRGTLIPVILFLGLMAACAGSPAPGPGEREAPRERQGVRGALTFEGEPLGGAYVFAYRSLAANLLGPADFASRPSGPDGSYGVELVRGSYYLVARKWMSGENSGPLTLGDLYRVYPSNPVTVDDGSFRIVDLDLGKMRDPMLFQDLSRAGSGTGVRGTIVDDRGEPVPWVFAMAYSTSDMKRIPDHTSSMTGADGSFVIYLPGGGKYWLAARKNLRERPAAGEPYGLYLGTEDHSVQVPEGEFVEGITIQLGEYRKGNQD